MHVRCILVAVVLSALCHVSVAAHKSDLAKIAAEFAPDSRVVEVPQFCGPHASHLLSHAGGKTLYQRGGHGTLLCLFPTEITTATEWVEEISYFVNLRLLLRWCGDDTELREALGQLQLRRNPVASEAFGAEVGRTSQLESACEESGLHVYDRTNGTEPRVWTVAYDGPRIKMTWPSTDFRQMQFAELGSEVNIDFKTIDFNPTKFGIARDGAVLVSSDRSFSLIIDSRYGDNLELRVCGFAEEAEFYIACATSVVSIASAGDVKNISEYKPKSEANNEPLTSVVKDIPNYLWDAFTLNNTVHVKINVKDDRQSNFRPYFGPQIRHLMFLAQSRIFNYYGDLDGFLYECLDAVGGLVGKSVLVVGSETPWYESIAFSAGAMQVTTVDYNRVDFQHPRFHTYTVAELFVVEPRPTFDVVMSLSSLEHDGLGRYGDEINPVGDIVAMESMRGLLKDDGLLFVSVPVGKDLLYWNAGRVYGERRLPLLFEGWRMVASAGVTGYDDPILRDPAYNGHFQPVFVLKDARKIK